jgi:hypothetical protein
MNWNIFKAGCGSAFFYGMAKRFLCGKFCHLLLPYN